MTAGGSDSPMSRAVVVLSRLGRSGVPRRIEHGESNHVWFAGDIVIRMATAPGPGDLLAEAELVTALPWTVGYPALIGTGLQDGHEWMATERIDGQNLGQAWPGLAPEEQMQALDDLYARLEEVHRTDLARVDSRRTTPFYALNAAQAARQLRDVRHIFDPATVRRLESILESAFPAIQAIPRAVVHTDAGPGNAVWDGRRAIPVDFEFACVGPADLDVENLARNTHDQPYLLQRLAELAKPVLVADGAYERILGYSVLRDLWAIGKWIAIRPGREGIENWEPVRGLRSHAAGTSWVARLFPAG